MRITGIVLPFILLITMISLEVVRNVGMMRVEQMESRLLEDLVEEDSSEEERDKIEELKLKEQLTNNDFRYCSWLREQSGNHIVGNHDLNYELPVTKAVFSPPEIPFS